MTEPAGGLLYAVTGLFGPRARLERRPECISDRGRRHYPLCQSLYHGLPSRTDGYFAKFPQEEAGRYIH